MTTSQYVRYLLFKDREIYYPLLLIDIMILLGILLHLLIMTFKPEMYKNLLMLVMLAINIGGVAQTFFMPVSFTYRKGKANSANLGYKVLIECYGTERTLKEFV